MKLTIERATLLKSLAHVQSVVERRNTIPILSNVKLEAGSWSDTSQLSELLNRGTVLGTIVGSGNQISLANFLIICLLYEDKKRLTIDDYVEVMSAISKDIQNSEEKKKLVINFFKKIDKNNLSIRLFDTY